MSEGTRKNGVGFGFGVVLGAVVGAGAMILGGNKEGKDVRDRVVEKIHNVTDNMKETFPEQTRKFEEIMEEALAEAQRATNEMREIGLSKKPKIKSEAAKEKASRRTFVRSGKPLNS
jgi:gas vesicle protein